MRYKRSDQKYHEVINNIIYTIYFTNQIQQLQNIKTRFILISFIFVFNGSYYKLGFCTNTRTVAYRQKNILFLKKIVSMLL